MARKKLIVDFFVRSSIHWLYFEFNSSLANEGAQRVASQGQPCAPHMLQPGCAALYASVRQV